MAFAGALLIVLLLVLLWGLRAQIAGFVGNGQVLLIVGLVIAGLIVGHVLGGPIEGDRTSLAMATA
jgi:hypothetical protein